MNKAINDKYIDVCEQLDIPVSVAIKQKLSLDDLLLLLERDYKQEISFYELETDSD